MRARRVTPQQQLLAWFSAHKRDLPWRYEPLDPYHVWVSEVMLQQTQVTTVLPYYARWLQRFPTLRHFAEASLEEVLKMWEGLGYYSRARNFHKAAQIVIRDLGGHIPTTVEGLVMLPGVGRYTAGAIASLAFNQHAPLLDGNVKRVLSRVLALEQVDGDWKLEIGDWRLRNVPTGECADSVNRKSKIQNLKSDDVLWRVAEALLPAGQAGAFNEALMELGATICTPRSPKCDSCPINAHCSAYAQRRQEDFPIKTARKSTPHSDVLTALLVDGKGRMLMGRRPNDGLLGGLWEFVSAEFRVPRAETVDEMVARRTGLRIDAEAAQLLGAVKHGFTHFTMTRQVWLVEHVDGTAPLLASGYDELRWVSLDECRRLALTRSDGRILDLYLHHRGSLFG
jgi:A/G-specific adenine glycosylase